MRTLLPIVAALSVMLAGADVVSRPELPATIKLAVPPPYLSLKKFAKKTSVPNPPIVMTVGVQEMTGRTFLESHKGKHSRVDIKDGNEVVTGWNLSDADVLGLNTTGGDDPTLEGGLWSELSLHSKLSVVLTLQVKETVDPFRYYELSVSLELEAW